MKEYDLKLNFDAFRDWDFITLYVSLKQMFYQQIDKLIIIDHVTESYIRKESLEQGVRYYENTKLHSYS